MTNTVQYHIYQILKIVKFTDIKDRMVVTKGWVEYRMFIYYLKHAGFQFCKMVEHQCECTSCQ